MVHIVSGSGGRAMIAQADEVKRRLLGEWTLVKYELFAENGEVRPGNYDVARINYGEREMSAHLMRSGGPTEPPTTDPLRAAAYQRYLAYFGPYTIDVAKQTVTHHVAGSSFPHWIGSEQVRHYAFTPNGQLTLSLKSGERVTQTLTWERAK
jgi:hypothetical protein